MSDSKLLCACPACAASRAASKSPIAPVRDLATAIREQRGDQPDSRQLRLTTALSPQPASTEGGSK